MNIRDEQQIIELSQRGQIDHACDRFEAEWMAGQVPKISDFLREAVAADQSDPHHIQRTLLEELIKIDLDHRWRRTGDLAIDQTDQSTNPSEAQVTQTSIGLLPDRAWLEDYAEHFPELGPLDDLPVRLIAEEYRVRLRWGDRPTDAEYARRFPRQEQKLVEALREVDAQWLHVVEALQIRVYADGQLVHSDILSGPVELGRQQPDESGPYCKSPREQGCRLVIASMLEDTVSRRHLFLELLPDGQLQVTNMSSSRSINFQSGGKLAAKDVCTAALPVLIMLGTRAIRVQQK